jgi:hypothetical protein
MTYEELAEAISKMSPEQRQSNVTVYVASSDEYYPVNKVDFSPEDDVLDQNHPFLPVLSVL